MNSADLLVLLHPAKNHGVANRYVAGVSSQALVDLDCQLPRRREYQCPDVLFAAGALILEHQFQQRKREGGGFAGSGLGAG